MVTLSGEAKLDRNLGVSHSLAGDAWSMEELKSHLVWREQPSSA